MLKEVCLTCRP